MIRSIASVSLGGSLRDKIYAARAAGFDALELTESVLAYSEMSPVEIRGLLEENELAVSLFHSIADVAGIAPELFDGALARLDRTFELMAALDATLLRVPSCTGSGSVDDESLVVEQLCRLADRAAAGGLKIAYEPLATGRYTNSWEAGWRIVDAAGHGHLGLMLDSFEVLAAGGDSAGIAEIPGNRIFHVQLADAHNAPVDMETLGRHFRCFPGAGSLDVPRFAESVAATGYQGAWSLEVLNDDLRSAPVRSAALDGYRSLIFIEERLFRSGKKTVRSIFENSEPPPVQKREEVRFIEFAVDADSRRALGAWLTSMGFLHVGHHRSKDVDIYRHGDVLMILNAGTDSFSHYYHHFHGTSACAIGLDVENRDAVLERATLYRYKTFDEKTGPDEYRMPAIRVPDGSLIHLVDDTYDPSRDFNMSTAPAPDSPFILRIDHLVRAVPADQFDTWVLFYRTMLGLHADASLDLSDPYGIVHSRALHDPQNRLRMPLAFSDSSRTVVARSLSVFGGAGINQIAFETPDIFAAATALEQRGAKLLPIPRNYYRELEQNQGLEAGLVERLQTASILYDTDENGGCFFHMYTDLFNGRFFFEFVQRVNGYDGYGERNAPVRMAAQARPH